MSKTLVFLLLIIISYWLINIAAAAQSEITTNDLGIKNPGMLPSSPFYFLKEWQRTITKFFTFNPIKKVELELQYANERAAEIKKMEEVAPQNFQAITKAVNNYEDNMEQLKVQLQKVATTSQNPNVDTLINNVVDTSIRHQELFDNLKNKFENDIDLENKLEAGQQKIDEIIKIIPQEFEFSKIDNLPQTDINTTTILDSNTTSTMTTSTPVIATSTLSSTSTIVATSTIEQ